MPKSEQVRFSDVLLLAQFQTVPLSYVVWNPNKIVWILKDNLCPKQNVNEAQMGQNVRILDKGSNRTIYVQNPNQMVWILDNLAQNRSVWA